MTEGSGDGSADATTLPLEAATLPREMGRDTLGDADTAAGPPVDAHAGAHADAHADAPPAHAAATELDTSPTPRLTADTEIGRYRLVTRLGAGAMGVVWSAIDPQLERKVAIKVVHPRLASSPEASQRMLREARAMAKLSHRAVVTVHDAGEADGRLFLAMELVDGETLTQRLRRPDLAAPGAWARRLALVLEAGRGLAAAHAAGVLHRDFKPDNVLVDEHGRVAVGDFGLATLRAAPRGRTHDQPDSHADLRGSDELELTTTGALLGTPMYMSPQQLRGNAADARSDQFAFCVAAYEAVYGVRPFAITERGLDAIPALITAIEAGRLEPGDATTEVPSAVRDVLRRGLAADPSARWPDLPSLLAALDTASGARARRRRRIGLAAAGVVLFALAASAGAVAYRRSETPVVLKRPMFQVARGGVFALGPDGHTVAVGYDHIEVHDDRRDRLWSVPLPPGELDVAAIAFERDGEVAYSTTHGGAKQIWHYRDETRLPSSPRSEQVWVAPLGDADLYIDGEGLRVTRLMLVHGGAVVRTWPLSYQDSRRLSASPDHTAIAYVDAATYEIVVLGIDGSVARSSQIIDATAIAWRDPTHVLVARGSLAPALLELELDADRHTLGPPRTLYAQDTGWLMQLGSRDGRIVFIDGDPISRVRLTGATNRDYEPSKLAGHVGWLPDGDLIGWNRTTHRLVRLRGGEANGDYGIGIDQEPVNATSAGDLLIVTVRSAPGRAVDAYDRRTGAQVWTRGDVELVRCAEDRAPPCVALRKTPGGSEIVDIDPATGALGAVRGHDGELNDIALAKDGRIWRGGGTTQLRELEADGHDGRTIFTGLATIRSIAFAPDGRLAVAGTAGASTYAVGYVDPAAGSDQAAFQPIQTTGTELLLLARVSPDGTTIAVMGRTYAAELDELILP